MWSRSNIVSDGVMKWPSSQPSVVKITATFDWDKGDPSVGINEGFR